MSPTIDSREVVCTYNHVHLKDGHSMALVVCSDETYRLAFDGRVISALAWKRDEIDECVDLFENFVFLHGGAKN